MHRLLTLLALALGSALAALPPDADRQLAREIYKEMIEIRSGYTTGSTTPVAEMAAARLRAAGFPDADIFVGGASPKKANLVVRYRAGRAGAAALKPILLLAHSDVVEANREDWSTDPFQFIERDGYFYGRGTSDDKAQAAVWIANLIRYKREGFKPERDIIVALTADEEGGGAYNGVIWLLKNKRELIDAELALNEGGGGVMVNGKKIANNIQVSEKTYADFKFEVHNRGGHSSVPVPDNAIYHLATALERLSRYSFPLKTDEVTRAYFREMAKVESGALKNELAKIADGSPEAAREAMQRVASISPRWNSMLRTTCVATELAGGHALNALPQVASANVNCRIFPGDSIDSVQKALRLAIGDEQVAIRVQGEVDVGPASPMRPDVLRAVARVSDTMWPGVLTIPVMSTGATDGRYLRVAGIPTYGVSGFFADRDDVRAHGRDERMNVNSFYEGQAFLYELVKDLSAGQ
ncbi:MAG TPA: M20/M25/M40 family metallo-hydrolase [Bryobacteraceae bacterium]|jgi:acetylornithine deacetylase/succinyl-diaminopimelate desuccinylase-like protein|nr:M20/M25/M40 family metallo-hydrolase [Bryobacteraceae bacterium]